MLFIMYFVLFKYGKLLSFLLNHKTKWVITFKKLKDIDYKRSLIKIDNTLAVNNIYSHTIKMKYLDNKISDPKA